MSISCQPQDLAASAKCFQCLPRGMLLSVRTHLLCQWVNLPTCDPDALAYIAAAGITNQTEIDAVCQLVSSLKSLPAVGTKYWDRELIIYPFLGTTFASQRVNLRSPGTFDFLNSTPPTYSNLGMQGNKINQYVDTQFTPSIHGGAIYTQNSARIMVYVDSEASGQFLAHFGAQDATRFARMLTPAFPPAMNFIYDVNSNNANAQSQAGALSVGAKFVQRNNSATTVESAFAANAWTPRIIAATGRPTISIFLLACSSTGVPIFFSDARISGFSLGAPLDVGHGAGVHTEHLEYKGIWDTFETAIGRGHP